MCIRVMCEAEWVSKIRLSRDKKLSFRKGHLCNFISKRLGTIPWLDVLYITSHDQNNQKVYGSRREDLKTRLATASWWVLHLNSTVWILPQVTLQNVYWYKKPKRDRGTLGARGTRDESSEFLCICKADHKLLRYWCYASSVVVSHCL